MEGHAHTRQALGSQDQEVVKVVMDDLKSKG